MSKDFTGMVPPHDEAAERAVVFCCLADLSGKAAAIAAEMLRPEWFHVWAYRTVFSVVCSLAAKGSQIDGELVMAELRDNGDLEKLGGRAAIEALTYETEAATDNVKAYCVRVERKARLRFMAGYAMELAYAAYTRNGHAEEEVQKHAAAILRVLESRSRCSYKTMAALALAEACRIEDKPETPQGIPTGLSTFDAVIGGLRRGELIVIAARPSMGKTALATTIIRHVAMSQPPRRVLFFSLEVSAEQITQHLIAQLANLDTRHVAAVALAPQQVRDAIEAAGQLHKNAPIGIEDGSGIDCMRIRARAQQTDGLSLIVVDYLQWMSEPSNGRGDNRVAQVGRIAKGLKEIAKDFRVPVIALAQLNRSVEQREGHRPRMSDLRESGDIEAHADVVALLHRPEYYERNKPELRGKAFLYVEKNRNGTVGEATLDWSPFCVRFSS